MSNKQSTTTPQPIETHKPPYHDLADAYFDSFQDGARAGAELAGDLADIDKGVLAVATHGMQENIRLARQNYELKHESTHDSLTGVLNLNGLEKYLASDDNLDNKGLALIDATNFKAINDKLGYQRGDDVLVGIAQLLAQSVRKDDIVARIGGDEFVVIIDTSGKQAQDMPAERRHTLNSKEQELDGFAKRSAKLMRAFLAANADIANHKLDLSIGTTLFDSTDPDFAAAKRRAELMMKQHKNTQHDTLGRYR